MNHRSTRFAIYRRKSGAVLIAVEIAITLAILCNAMALIVDRVAWSMRPTGIDEANIFLIYATSVENPASPAALQASDLNLLHSIVGVANAYATNSFPLQGGGWSMDVRLTAEQKTASAHVSYYFGDEQALDTLGVKLISGRNFTASEVVNRDANTIPPAAEVIITRALAQKLFPGGDALGKSIYVETNEPVPIVGIIDRLQGPFVAATGFNSTFAESSVLAPYRRLSDSATYVVRTQPGHLNQALKEAQSRLADINGSRIISAESMREVRARAYRGNRSLTLLLAAVSLILVAVTAFGMVGLTSYWVAQRRRQIGIRRALGATRLAILRQFQQENLVIAVLGAVAGVTLSVVLNLWLVQHFEMIRIHAVNVAGAAVALILLGQMAVYWPARHAASVSPAAAVRGAQFRESNR
jgi:putative ABC transport system permease protein